MTKNPIYNALAATIYIVLIVSLLNMLSSIVPDMNEYIAPVILLSLFTFSTGVMGYIFGYYPFKLFIENKQKEGLSLFLKSLGCFGGIIVLIVVGYILII